MVGIRSACVKPVVWIRSSKDDLTKFPREAVSHIGFALKFAQLGGKHENAKPLRGIVIGAGVLEIIEDYDGDTYRAVYTVRFEEAIYVLHCFRKKSRRGIETPRSEIDLIKERYKVAKELHERRIIR